MSETERLDGAVPQRVFCDDAPVSTYETQAEAERRVRRVGQPAWDAGEIARSALGELGPKRRVALMAELLCEMHGLEAVELLSKVRASISLRMQELINLHMGVLDGGEPADPMRMGFFDPEEARRLIVERRGQIQNGPNSSNPPMSVALDEGIPEPCPPFASIPWAGVNSREQAAAFLSEASGEDIDLMARLLLEGRPIPDAWRPAQSHIVSALFSSAALLRQMTSARAEVVAPRKIRWRSRGSAQGGRS